MAYTPADTAILNKVGLRLANITTANGYNNEFKKIKRSRTIPFKGFDLPAANYYHATVSSEKTPYGREKKTQLLIVEAHSLTRDDPFINIADSLAADIVIGLFRAVLVPKVTDVESVALGGLVTSLNYTGHEPFIGQGQEPFCGTLVQFEVVYETDIGSM